MKELSIEEKAKRYDEAIAKGKQIQNTPYTAHWDIMKEVVEHLFPELKESEDERIRKALIKLVKKAGEGYENVIDGVSLEKAISWLEKQGEQPKKNDVCNNCDQQGSCVSPCPMKLVEKQGEQKLADNVEPKFRIGDEIKTTNEEPLTITKINEKGYWSGDLFICDFNNSDNWELVEQKPAWSEEDEKQLNDIIELLPDLSNRHNWLKSLKDRVQPKQEWSEEDEELLRDVSDTYFYNDEDYPEETYKQMLKRVLDWMNKRAKSFRSQNTWKPSKEQITVLHDVAAYIDNSIYPNQKDILANLYLQLKKLMEE